MSQIQARGTKAEVVPYDDAHVSQLGGNPITAFNATGIDIQIATAHKFPRSIATFLAEAEDLVTSSVAVAASCTYALPRAGKTITGPSVRLAELLAYAWGNMRTAAMITGDDGKFVVAQAISLDLQKNVGFSVEARRRVTDKTGKRYDDDMIAVASNAAISIALRNGIFRIIPRTYVDVLQGMARQVAAGKVGDLESARLEWLGLFTAKGVPEKDVFRALGVKGLADVTSEHLMTLQGFHTSIKEGMATLEEIFAPPQTSEPGVQGPPPASRAAGLAEKLKPKGEARQEGLLPGQ